jgi:hypothetical protein
LPGLARSCKAGATSNSRRTQGRLKAFSEIVSLNPFDLLSLTEGRSELRKQQVSSGYPYTKNHSPIRSMNMLIGLPSVPLQAKLKTLNDASNTPYRDFPSPVHQAQPKVCVRRIPMHHTLTVRPAGRLSLDCDGVLAEWSRLRPSVRSTNYWLNFLLKIARREPAVPMSEGTLTVRPAGRLSRGSDVRGDYIAVSSGMLVRGQSFSRLPRNLGRLLDATGVSV